MKRSVTVVAALAGTITLLLSSCSQAETASDETAVQVGGGIFEGRPTKDCIDNGVREINWGSGAGDNYFYYPESQRVYDFRGGEGAWVWVSAHTSGGCGAFNAELSALFEVRQGPFGPELVTRFAGQEAPESAPEALVDREGDGRVEILFPSAHLRPTGAKDFALEELAVPSFDCPC